MSHYCHRPGCWIVVPPKMMACKPHWLELPKSIRDEVWAEYVHGQEITKTPSMRYLVVYIKCLLYWKGTPAPSGQQEKHTMAQGQLVSMNRLKDGVIAGFRVSEIKTFQAEVEAQSPTDGMIHVVNWTKIQVTLTHDASQLMSQKDPYAVASVDPARPLVLKLHTFLIPQANGRPTPAEKAPSSDRMRWAFIKYDTIQKILKYGGYIPRSVPQQRFPLPGTVFMETALSGGNNYPRKIGGPEIIDEKRIQQEELALSLDAICGMGEGAQEGTENLDDALESHVTGEPIPEVKPKHKAR